MLGVALYFIGIIAVVRATTSTCTNVSTPKGANGFGVRFYSYPYNSTAGWDPNFFRTGYRTTLLNTLTHVTSQNFLNSNGNLFGYNINSRNYTVELDAVIQAPDTGTYTFTIGANDGFSVQIGLNQTCCDDFQGSGFGDFRMDVLGPMGSLSDGLTTATASVNFTKNVWYPVKIIMFNAYGPDGLNIYAESPTKSSSKIGELISQTPLGQKCVFPIAPVFQSITKVWDEPYSSTTTSLGSNGALTPIVFVPHKRKTTLTSTLPDGSVETDSGVVLVGTDSKGSLSTSVSLFPHTGTVGTTLITTTKSDGSVDTDSGIVLVGTDSKGSLSTSVSLFPHTGTVGTTLMTTTKSDGSVDTDSGIVLVGTDSKGSLSTSVSLFPHTGTVGTTLVTTTKSDGSVETDSGIVLVGTDSKGSLSTSVSLFPHTGTVGTTLITTTKSDGSVETDSGIVLVGTDSKGSLSTSVSLFPHTGTVGTTLITTTKSDGSVDTDSGIVLVGTDSKGSLSISTSLYPRTGTVGTTTITTTKSGGSVETKSGVVIVEEDSQGSLSTSTSLYPRTGTSFKSVITPTASGSFSTLPGLSAHSTGLSTGVSSNPGGWNSSLVAPSTSKSFSSSSLTYSSSDGSPFFSDGSTSSSHVSREPGVSFSRSSESEGSVSPARSSSSVVTSTRIVVITKTNVSGLTEVETTTITTTYCPFSTSRHAEKIGPNGSKDQGGPAMHTDSSGISPFDDVPKEQTITSAPRKASVIGSGIAISNDSPNSSSRLAAELSAIVTSSPSPLSIAPDKTTAPVSSAASSSYSSSVPVYEGLARVTSPMTVMIFIPILALAL